MKHLTKIFDFSREEAEEVLDLAERHKEKHDLGLRYENVLGGKVVAMVFEKPSLRTKLAFEVATASLGGTPVFLSSAQILASGGHERGRESIPDIARNLERFSDLIIARVYDHAVIQEIASSISKPVINALCDTHHPSQAFADMLAIRLKFGKEASPKVTYIGDGNNVATSLVQICALLGLNVSVASPRGYEIPESEVQAARAVAEKSGSKLQLFENPLEAVENTDVVYTDTFVSMGQEEEKEQRKAVFQDYQVNAKLMKHAGDQAVFMHCLPAHRGEEVTSEVMDSDQSIVFDQAESRLHIARALLELLLKK